MIKPCTNFLYRFIFEKKARIDRLNCKKYLYYSIFKSMVDVVKSQSLANRYRPQTFDEMIGQQHIIWILKAKMKSDSSSLQNYLLCWPRWTWKTTSARILAKAINCLGSHDWNPCNKCANCELINSWKTTDYVEIDAASNTWVDNVREVIINQADYQPISLKKKIYVIDEVHMLSTAAFNALLKTIEEPSWNVCFILATTELQKVPQTIISRVQVFNFKKIPQDEMVTHLWNICKTEWFEYEDEALELIATISEWCVRDGIKYLDQVSVLWKISTENVSQFLWISTDATIESFFDIVKWWDRNQIFEQIDKLAQWTDLQQFAKQCLGYINDHIMDDVDFYLKASEAFSEIIRHVRFYPYPWVLYKIAFNKYLQWDNEKNIIKSEKDIEKRSESKLEEKENKNEKELNLEEKVKSGSNEQHQEVEKVKDTNNKDNWELWEHVVKWIQSSTTRQILKDHMTIDKITDNEIILIHDNSIMAKTILEKDSKELEDLLEKELGKRVTLTVQWMSKEEYFQRLMWM